jgi:hypothetical protein
MSSNSQLFRLYLRRTCPKVFPKETCLVFCDAGQGDSDIHIFHTQSSAKNCNRGVLVQRCRVACVQSAQRGH